MPPYAEGIDISMWETDTTSTAPLPNLTLSVRNGAQFVYVRGGFQTTIDPAFNHFWQKAHDSNLIRGAYWYLTWLVEPTTQMLKFINTINAHPTGKGDLPMVVDFEERYSVPTPANARLKLKQALDYLENNTGRVPMIYTAPSYWLEFGSPDPSWAKYPLWIANYQQPAPNIPEPWKSAQGWKFWQYHDKLAGRVYGFASMGLDGDFFNGSIAELQAYAGRPTPPTPEQAIRLDEIHRMEATLQTRKTQIAG